MSITKLDQMFEVLKSKPKKRIVAAFANDLHTVEAVNEAFQMGIVDATLVGDEATIRKNCASMNINPDNFKIVQEADEMKAAMKAVEIINAGEGDILMKGLVSTDKYAKAILNKEKGLMPAGGVLSHVTVMETPNYHKLLIVGDVALIPLPDLKQKMAIINYLISTAKALGIEKPKVALLAASEQVAANIPSSMEATILSKMAERGQIKGALIDGPLSLDLAIDRESVEIKGIKSEVAGDADCILFPNIESGNVFYKANTKLCNAELGALVMGAKVPCVLSSRGDTAKTKLYSIALAAMTAK